MELTASQADTIHRGEMSERDELVSKLKADVAVFEERLAQNQSQVRKQTFWYMYM